MSATLESYVNRPVSVITSDGRNFVGTLKVTIVSFYIFLSPYLPFYQCSRGDLAYETNCRTHDFKCSEIKLSINVFYFNRDLTRPLT